MNQDTLASRGSDATTTVLSMVALVFSAAAGAWVLFSAPRGVLGSSSTTAIAIVLLALLVVAGAVGAAQPKRALAAGLVIIVLGLVAFVVVNLGGYLIGTVLCLIAGTLDVVAGVRFRKG